MRAIPVNSHDVAIGLPFFGNLEIAMSLSLLAMMNL